MKASGMNAMKGGIAVVMCAVLLMLVSRQTYGESAQKGTAPKVMAGQESVAKMEAMSDVFRRVAKHASPAVVHILATKKVEKAQRGIDPEDLPEALRKFFDDQSGPGSRRWEFRIPQEMQPRPQTGSGSGVIIDADKGYIITNNHVVEDIDKDKESGRIDVHLSDGRRLPAQVIGKDPKTDLALIQIKADQLTALPLGDSTTIEVGDWVLAIGAPFGLEQTVTQGIVSAKGRNPGIVEGYEEFIQTDAAINPGNSGGPLLNLKGEVIGINTAIVTRGMVAQYAGIGFAIPSETVKDLLPNLIEGKEIVRGYLGVSIQGFDTAPPGLAKTFGLAGDTGVVVEDVLESSPAGKAGLKAEDVILSFHGESVKTVRNLQARVARTPPGTKVDLKVWRDKKEITIPVTIEKQPKKYFSAEGSWNNRKSTKDEEGESGEEGEAVIDLLGMTVEPLTPNLAKKYGWEDSKENQALLVVTAIEPLGEAAAGLGIEVGDLILSVQGKKVTSGRALQEVLSGNASEKEIRLRIKSVRTGRSRTVYYEIPDRKKD